MSTRTFSIFVSLAIACGALCGKATSAAPSSDESAFIFRGVSYFHRWSKDDQHEFTPEGQEDLDKWSDMITVNAYPNVDEGEGLATTANAVLENYKSHGARVLKTSSIPRKAERPAEHFIAVLFTQPDFIEVAFARFTLVDGKGYSFIYSHRIYGEQIGDQASAWLSANGEETEKALLEWSFMPSPSLLR
jgi:hypothetical protein